MKRIVFGLVCVLIAVCVITCTKSTTKSANPPATCTVCLAGDTALAHVIDTSGLYYFLPTAFTPNSDGINDVFYLIYDKLNVDSSSITIWDMSGKGVFKGPITQGWDGRDLNGNKCPAGGYPVYVKIWTLSGKVIDMCTCVTILTYKGNCISTNGYTYYLGDQLDITKGFVNPTTDHLCL